MENLDFHPFKTAGKHWYLPLISGILFVCIGILVFSTPLESYLTLAVIFAITFLFTGVIEIIYAIANHKKSDNWGWSLTGGIIDFLLGVLLVSRPEITVIVLPFYIGFGILFRSIMAIGWSLELKRQQVADWGNLLAVGILGGILAFILLWNPLLAGFTIIFYTALAFLVIGIFQIYLSFKLRKINKL